MMKASRKMNKAAAGCSFACVFVFALFCILLHTSPDRLIGAAFCHQIPGRSPAFSFPFCYRCSGLFSGIFCGLAVFLLSGGRKKFSPVKPLLFFGLSLIVFLTDILNSSKFPFFRLYPETTGIRFLSAYPLGFSLAFLIAGIFRFLFAPDLRGERERNVLKLLLFPAGGALAYFLVFSESYVLSIVSRVCLCAACVGFLSLLYSVLVKCIMLLRNNQKASFVIYTAGFSLAVLQIILFGALHIRFLDFESLFS